MINFNLLKSYIKYYFKASSLYQVHSPFVYEFAEQILEDDRNYYAFNDVEKLRYMLQRNTSKVQLTDYGAGSQQGLQKQKSVGQIAKSAASRQWQCQTLFRLVNFYKPKTMLEMGTSLGISTLYQSSASLNADFITLEGDPNIAALAQLNFDELKAENITLEIGQFDQTLTPSLKKLKQLDYVFIDGNHRLTPTLAYFEECLKYAHDKTIFVFDDIHWSDEMEEAWLQVKAHPSVTVSIDLFHMGVVFIRQEQKQKEHFELIPLKWKPWNSASSFFR